MHIDCGGSGPGTAARGMTRTGPRALAAAALVATLLGWPARGDACDPAHNPRHETDPAHAMDVRSPGEVTVAGRVLREQICGTSGVEIDVAAVDDRTPASQLGYRVTWIGGELPRHLMIPDHPVRAINSNLLIFTFDGDDDDAVAIELEVAAVDLNGNVGPATRFDVVGSEATGCSAAGRAGGLAPTLAGLLAMLLARWRIRAVPRRTH